MTRFILKGVPEAEQVVIVVYTRPFDNHTKTRLNLGRVDGHWEIKHDFGRKKLYYYYKYKTSKWHKEGFFNTAFGLRIFDNEDSMVRHDEWNKIDEINSRRACAFLWRNPIVAWDGRVTVCCNDPKFEMCLGSIEDTDLVELWNGSKITEYRLAHIMGDFNATPKSGPFRIPICLTCWNMPVMDDAEIQEYLKDKPELFEAYKRRVNPC